MFSRFTAYTQMYHVFKIRTAKTQWSHFSNQVGQNYFPLKFMFVLQYRFTPSCLPLVNFGCDFWNSHTF